MKLTAHHHVAHAGLRRLITVVTLFAAAVSVPLQAFAFNANNVKQTNALVVVSLKNVDNNVVAPNAVALTADNTAILTSQVTKAAVNNLELHNPEGGVVAITATELATASNDFVAITENCAGVTTAPPDNFAAINNLGSSSNNDNRATITTGTNVITSTNATVTALNDFAVINSQNANVGKTSTGASTTAEPANINASDSATSTGVSTDNQTFAASLNGAAPELVGVT